MFMHRQRMQARTGLSVAATMHIGVRTVEARLVNVSSRGVLAMVDAPPPRGTLVEIEIGGDVVRGQVRWRKSDRCGIALRSEVSVPDLLEGRAVPVTHVSERLTRRKPLDIFRRMLG